MQRRERNARKALVEFSIGALDADCANDGPLPCRTHDNAAMRRAHEPIVEVGGAQATLSAACRKLAEVSAHARRRVRLAYRVPAPERGRPVRAGERDQVAVVVDDSDSQRPSALGGRRVQRSVHGAQRVFHVHHLPVIHRYPPSVACEV